MSLRIRYSDPRGIDEPAAMVSLSSNARWGDVSLSMSAEVGDPATSSQGIEDPGGIYDFVGLRALEFAETSAPSNNQIIGRFTMQNRRVRRDAERALITGADRFWEIDLTDYNWHLGSRIHTDADAERPAESAGDRIRWLLASAANISLNDYGNVAYPTTSLDQGDFRGQRPTDLLSDALVEGGYNFWVDHNEAHERPELFVLDPAGSSYQSTVRISNDIADIDSLTIFAPWMDATLERSPSRIAYGAYVAFANGAVYVRNDVVGEQFARLDQTAPMANVKTAARATRVGNKFLADNDEESDRIVVTIKVPASQVNDIRHGQSLSVKFTHLPGYEAWTPMRVLRRAVIQEEQGGDGYYKIVLEMVPGGVNVPYSAACIAIGASLTAAGTYGGNHSNITQAPGNLFYVRGGMTVPTAVQIGFEGNWHFADYANDAAGDCVGNGARVVVAGGGVLTVTVADWINVHTFAASLSYNDGGDVPHEVRNGLAPGSYAFTVPDDEHCYHYVDVSQDGGDCGGKWQFVSWQWEPV